MGLVLLDLDQQREERGQESGAYSHRNQISSGYKFLVVAHDEGSSVHRSLYLA